ncbi:MAG: hypothetical protein IPH44_41790 [Myxococcales bacterium]|nr:hypothetical protein [Myxococcales bacterium]MBK7193069.1 hypothetical protein [Myxococcales bacterium]
MANYKLFNGVGAAVTAPVGFTADVDLIFDMGQPPHRASIDLTQTPTRDYAKATIEDTGVYDTGKPITTTGNHYREHPAFPVTTVVPGSTEQHGALYLEEAEFATRAAAAGGAGRWPDGYGYKSHGAYQFQAMVYDDKVRAPIQRRYHGFHARVVSVVGTVYTLDVASFHKSTPTTLTTSFVRVDVDIDQLDQCTKDLCTLQPIAGSEGCIFLAIAFCAKTNAAGGAILRGPKLPPQG